jgi:hypothetical protein
MSIMKPCTMSTSYPKKLPITKYIISHFSLMPRTQLIYKVATLYFYLNKSGDEEDRKRKNVFNTFKGLLSYDKIISLLTFDIITNKL